MTGSVTGFNPANIALSTSFFTPDPALSGGTWSVETNVLSSLTQFDAVYSIPEPSDIALLALGGFLSLMIGLRRRA